MKSYESCLFPIFQELYSNILAGIYPSINISNHISNFVSALKNDESQTGMVNALQRALNEAELCQQCANCKKCAHQFYLAVAENKIDNFKNTDFFKLKEKLESEYGKLSFRTPPSYLKYHFDKHDDLKQGYTRNFEQNKQGRSIDNNLIMLKGMSSSSPFIYNGAYTAQQFTGGGLYLRYNGHGIAIDPGYGFVENMRRNKISIYDIDTIIITHHHIDHTNDMRIIDDLNHQFQEKKHILNWFIDKTTYDYHYHGFNKNINKYTIVEEPHSCNKYIINDKISFTVFKTEHIKDYSQTKKDNAVYETQTFGFVVDLKSTNNKIIKIGYTSDTRYYCGLEDYIDGCNILIANISGIYYDDYLLVSQKQTHLGYSGCYNILKKTKKKPEIFVVSEFWNGTTDLRFDVCKALANEIESKIKVIPGDIGLHINVDDLKIKCSKCGKYKEPSNLFATKPLKDFEEITYVCNECLL